MARSQRALKDKLRNLGLMLKAFLSRRMTGEKYSIKTNLEMVCKRVTSEGRSERADSEAVAVMKVWSIILATMIGTQGQTQEIL